MADHAEGNGSDRLARAARFGRIYAAVPHDLRAGRDALCCKLRRLIQDELTVRDEELLDDIVAQRRDALKKFL
jgi:hypothetical protein